MATVRTAVAVPQDVHEQADVAAKQMAVSRSAFYTLALRQLLERMETQRMIGQINEAYGDGLTEEEERVLKGFQRLSARSIR